METIPIDKVFPATSPEAQAALSAADVIIGVDLSTEREFTVFGTPALESTTSLKKLSAMRVVRVALAGQTRELERLIALVERIKGSEVYRGTDA